MCNLQYSHVCLLLSVKTDHEWKVFDDMLNQILMEVWQWGAHVFLRRQNNLLFMKGLYGAFEALLYYIIPHAARLSEDQVHYLANA